MPKTSNELLLDATIRHQIRLLRFSSGQAKAATLLLLEADDELTKLLRSADLTAASEARLRSVLADVRRLRDGAMAHIGDRLREDLEPLAQTEADWEVEAIQGTAPVQLSLTAPPVSVLKAVTGRPINGVPLEGWLGQLAQSDVGRIEQQIRLGVLQGETIEQMVRRIRGTKANGYEDGVTAITRRNAQTIARTAVNHVSNQARHEVWNANADIIDGIRWVATLDGRTSDVCRGRDGEVYPIDVGPRPPAHPGCRSTTTAVIAGERIVGDRPMVRDSRTREAREKDFRAEAAEAAGDKWKDMSAAERSAAVAARRKAWTAENVGTVPSTTTYDSWLRKQPAEFQDDVLGPGKAGVFRKGLTLDKFIDERGKPYTLAELQAEVAGDKLNVVQPAIGMKAKALLQMGLESDAVLSKIKAEFPDASTSLASIASYKSELKKAGLLDQLAGIPPTGKIAVNADGAVQAFEANLPAGVKHALGGQWATVAEKLEGVPGAYGYYQAGKGVVLDAAKLSSIPAVQARQVIAHELGHLLHKQHDLAPFSEVQLKNAMVLLDPDEKKLYGYYLSHPDELMAELTAQALSPSPITSQGLSAAAFNKKLSVYIDDVKAALAEKFPAPSPKAPAPMPGGPTAPFEVAGKHSSASSLAKALLQQGMPDAQVAAAVKAEFPEVKLPGATVASAKSQLKKSGGLVGVGQSGPVVAAKPAPQVAQVPHTPEAAAIKPSIAKPVSTSPLSGVQLKALGVEMFEEGVLDSKTVAEALKQQHPASAHLIKVENVASWKSNWKKQFPERYKEAEALAVEAAKKAAKSGPTKLPKLAGKSLGSHSTLGLNKLKAAIAAGETNPDALMAILKQHFGSTFSESAGADLIELAHYEVLTGKSVAKPYLSAAYQAVVPKPAAKPQPLEELLEFGDTDTALKAEAAVLKALAKAKEKFATSTTVQSEIAKDVLANIYGPPYSKFDHVVDALIAKAKGEALTTQAAYAALSPAEQAIVDKIKALVASSTWTVSTKAEVAAQLKLIQSTSPLDDLIALANGKLPVGLEAKKQALAASAAARASARTTDMTPARPAATPREGFPPPPRFTRQQRIAAVRAVAGSVQSSKINSINASQRRAGLPELSEDEVAAIVAYTGSTYRKVNHDLRVGKYASDMSLQAFVEAAQDGLRKMAPHSGLTHRGITLQPGALEAALSTYRVGAIVEENAFISSSYGGEAAFSGNVYIHIEGQSGRNVTSLSRFGSSEREVLFMPGTRLQVTKVEQAGGVYNVYMKELTDVEVEKVQPPKRLDTLRATAWLDEWYVDHKNFTAAKVEEVLKAHPEFKMAPKKVYRVIEVPKSVVEKHMLEDGGDNLEDFFDLDKAAKYVAANEKQGFVSGSASEKGLAKFEKLGALDDSGEMVKIYLEYDVDSGLDLKKMAEFAGMDSSNKVKQIADVEEVLFKPKNAKVTGWAIGG